MNELTIFNYGNKGIRTTLINNEPWFVGKDVAEILGYKNTKDALISHIDEDDKKIIQRSDFTTIENYIPKSALAMNLVHADVPNRGLTIINESGLYSLIFSSKLEGAKKFKKWVTSEVLPSIRKYGMYATNEKLKDMEIKINELQNSSPISKLIKEIQQANINLTCAEVQSSVRESLNSVTTTTTVRLYPERKRKVINIFEL